MLARTKFMPRCYMCEEPSTGKEHVPPKCMFPKAKDLSADTNLRNDLITVPSCDGHNSEKSHDDQYFLNVVVGCECINEVGREHYRNQIRRQNRRNPSILSRLAMNAIDAGDNIVYGVEMNRLDTVVVHLAHALYFAHFGNKPSGKVSWFPEFLSRTELEAEHDRLVTIEEVDKEFKCVPYCGANPTVFAYQVIEYDEEQKMRLHFYEGCRILLIFSR